MPASTFANGEVKEFKEVREVKAICFTDRYSTQKAVGYNFYRPKGVITSLTSITSELAKVQYLKDKAEDWEKAEKAKNRPKMRLL